MPLEKLEYIADPRRLCKCGAEMHYCSDSRQSGRSWGGASAIYRGCMGRDNIRNHPQEGDWFLCLWCDVKERV